MPQPLSIHQALREAAALLEGARDGSPRLTAEILLASRLGRDRAFLYAHPEEILTSEQQALFGADLEQRCAGKPAQYITGVQEFFGLSFEVNSDVLIPRPETELLVEQALLKATGGVRILDVGTGSGAIAITLRKQLPGAVVFASDISRPALAVARRNARTHDAELHFVEADALQPFRALAFDLIVSNPPYVGAHDSTVLQREVRDFEPPTALFAGKDGLDVYRALAQSAHQLLKPGGWLLMEIGYNLCAAVAALFGDEFWEPPTVRRDLAGWDRVLALRRKPAGAGGP
jgi:release factor glutamine methyltransferase